MTQVTRDRALKNPKLSPPSVTMPWDNYNEAVVAVINSQTAKCKKLLYLLRQLVLVALKNNIHCKAEHIEGAKNILPDRLSRLKFDDQFIMNHSLQKQPEVVPEHLRPEKLTHNLTHL